MDFLDLLEEKLKVVEWGPEIMQRAVNAGFSGGEKKRNEILQMAVLEPTLAILDETDSGLDIDALRIVANGVNCPASRPDSATIVVTHYQRLLNYIVPGLRARAGRRADRQVGRQGAGARARGEGLRVADRRGGGGGVTDAIRAAFDALRAGGARAGVAGAAPAGRDGPVCRGRVPDRTGRGVAVHAGGSDRPDPFAPAAPPAAMVTRADLAAGSPSGIRNGRAWCS